MSSVRRVAGEDKLGGLMPSASSPYAALAVITIGFLLLVVVAFAIGGYTREAIIALGMALAVIAWAAWGGRRT